MTRSLPPLARTALSSSGLWCWQATLEAFGVTVAGDGPQFGEFTLGHLHRAGYRLAWLDTSTWNFDEDDCPTWRERRPTLNRFIIGHPEGDYVIGTAGHVMALRDGKLTDTDLAGTGRRLVQVAYSVERATK